MSSSLPSQVFSLEEAMGTADRNHLFLVFTFLAVTGECRLLLWLTIQKRPHRRKPEHVGLDPRGGEVIS